jgi:DNA polymerase I-like protein with 3'-5' exonuclease and polymerase domains
MNKLLLIDGNSLINRSFYAIRLLSNKKGVYTNAITGFFNALLKLQNRLTPLTHIAVAFDLRAPTFRHEMYDGYKKRRKGMPEELAVQMPHIKEILDLMGIARIELSGFEADDIIGTLSKNGNSPCFTKDISTQVYIATGDKDSFQLISENVSVCLASNKEEVCYSPEKIEEVYGIKPLQFIEIKALMGDSSDDIPGVQGIGEKTAFSLVQKYSSVDYIYENLDSLDISKGVKSKLEKDKAMCYLSRQLGIIKTDVPIDLSLESYEIKPINKEKLSQKLSELEIFSLLKKLELEPTTVGSGDPDTPQASEDSRVTELEEKLDVVLRDMEKVGVKIDTEGMERYGKELEPQIETIQEKIHELAGEQFNIASPKQLSEILFEKLMLPNPKKNSTNAEVLQGLAETHSIIPLILEYRALTKLNSTYVQGLLSHAKEDGRIHTTFKNETNTGRLSSVDPNIQNIPVRTERGRIMRRFFIAEQGKLLIDADYSQIELRVLAHIANDTAMLSAFKNDEDIHAMTAEQVFGTSKMRSAAKAVNFGIVYGMGAFSLAKEIGVSVGEAKEYIERYLDKYSGVREYLEKTVNEAKSSGYVKTLLGRVRYIPEIQSSNKNIIAAGERIAKNTPIQGTAADIIKLAMVRGYNRLKSSEAKLILQVHDELIAEATEALAEETATIISEEMVAAGKELNIDLTVDIGIGRSWYEC